MAIIPFKNAAKGRVPKDLHAPAQDASENADILGCVRFTMEEMQEFLRLRSDENTGETVFKDVTLRASSHEAGYNFKLSAELPVHMSICKIHDGTAYAYKLHVGSDPAVILRDFTDVVEMAQDVRDAAIAYMRGQAHQARSAAVLHVVPNPLPDPER